MYIFLMFLGCFYELPYSHIAHNYILLLHAQILHVVVSGPFELPYSYRDRSYIQLLHEDILHFSAYEKRIDSIVFSLL